MTGTRRLTGRRADPVAVVTSCDGELALGVARRACGYIAGMADGPDYLTSNRAYWDANAPRYAASGEESWSDEPKWGLWGVPEADVGLLPRDMTGLDTIELGCGTAYVSAWLARRGARVWKARKRG